MFIIERGPFQSLPIHINLSFVYLGIPFKFPIINRIEDKKR